MTNIHSTTSNAPHRTSPVSRGAQILLGSVRTPGRGREVLILSRPRRVAGTPGFGNTRGTPAERGSHDTFDDDGGATKPQERHRGSARRHRSAHRRGGVLTMEQT